MKKYNFDSLEEIETKELSREEFLERSRKQRKLKQEGRILKLEDLDNENEKLSDFEIKILESKVKKQEGGKPYNRFINDEEEVVDYIDYSNLNDFYFDDGMPWKK